MLPVRFHLPGVRYNYPLNMMWLSLLKQYPEYFRENIEIGSFFGSFPFSLWNGGRFINHDQCDTSFVKNVIKAYNDAGVPIRYTFNSTEIHEPDLEDPFCNFCMEAAHNGMNEVMIASPLLEKYLREKYPNYAYNSSTCKEIKDIETLNKEIDKPYKYVVLDYNLNNNWDLINEIKKPEKVEVLVNTLCEPGCRRRGDHYKNIAKNNHIEMMNRKLPDDKKIPIEPWYCKYGDYNCVHTIQDYPTYISPEDIYEKYIPAGINNFKIEGRTANIFSLVETYTHFMIKPQHQGYVRIIVLNNLANQKVITVNKPRPGVWP